jgi:hypothetical protein
MRKTKPAKKIKPRTMKREALYSHRKLILILKISNPPLAYALIFEDPRNGNGIKDSDHFGTRNQEPLPKPIPHQPETRNKEQLPKPTPTPTENLEPRTGNHQCPSPITFK